MASSCGCADRSWPVLKLTAAYKLAAAVRFSTPSFSKMRSVCLLMCSPRPVESLRSRASICRLRSSATPHVLFVSACGACGPNPKPRLLQLPAEAESNLRDAAGTDVRTTSNPLASRRASCHQALHLRRRPSGRFCEATCPPEQGVQRTPSAGDSRARPPCVGGNRLSQRPGRSRFAFLAAVCASAASERCLR